MLVNGTRVVEIVEEGDNMVASTMRRVRVHNLTQKLDLVTGSFGIATGGLNHFQRRVSVSPE